MDEWLVSAIYPLCISIYRELVEMKWPWRVSSVESPGHCANSCLEDHAQPNPDLDAIWRLAAGLDLGRRSVLEAEVLLWRICTAKSMPAATIRRALNHDWESS